jgi:spore coat protein I
MSGTYTRIKRHEIKELIESKYGLAVLNMQERENGILIFTETGTKRLRRAKRDEAKIQFAASAYEYLTGRGFTNISRINRTLDGEYIISYNGGKYLLQDFVPGRLMEIKTTDDAVSAARALARLHKAGEGFVPASGSHARVDWGRWMDKFKANAINIKKYNRNLLEKKELTKFDKLYVKHAEEYYEKMFNSYLMLRNFGYLEKVQQSMMQNQLAHKEFRRHALLMTENNEIFVSNLENCAYDIREADIATLLESFSGKNKAELARAAIKAYSEIIRLDRNSIKIIQGFLLEPKRFYKVIERYYGRKKNFTEAELLNKLERAIKKEARKAPVLQALEDYRTI